MPGIDENGCYSTGTGSASQGRVVGPAPYAFDGTASSVNGTAGQGVPMAMPKLTSDVYYRDSKGNVTALFPTGQLNVTRSSVNDTLDKPAQDLTDFTKLQYLELSLREPYITRDDYDRAVDLAVKRLRDDQRRYHQKHQDRTEQRARMEQTYKKLTTERLGPQNDYFEEGDLVSHKIPMFEKTFTRYQIQSMSSKEYAIRLQFQKGFARQIDLLAVTPPRSVDYTRSSMDRTAMGKAEPVDCTGLPLIRMGQTASSVNDTPKASPEWADQGTKSVVQTPKGQQDLVSGPAYQGQTYCSCGKCESR